MWPWGAVSLWHSDPYTHVLWLCLNIKCIYSSCKFLPRGQINAGKQLYCGEHCQSCVVTIVEFAKLSMVWCLNKHLGTSLPHDYLWMDIPTSCPPDLRASLGMCWLTSSLGIPREPLHTLLTPNSTSFPSSFSYTFTPVWKTDTWVGIQTVGKF